MKPAPASGANRTAARAAAAADALLAWYESQAARPPRENRPAGSTTAAAQAPVSPSGPLDRGPAAGMRSAGETGRPEAGLGQARRDPHGHAPRLAHTDWLYHRLCIAGPADDASAFRLAAAGAGIVPWPLDVDQMEEDMFHLLITAASPADAASAAARVLSLSGARSLADQIVRASARRHTLAMAQIGRSSACPFDLHALIPVPDDILRLGPDAPAAIDWLWTHWGTTQPLRHVRVIDSVGNGDDDAVHEARFSVNFWSADWSPWQALTRLVAQWPRLNFALQPVYDLP